ncbi:MAG TPA: acylneuraminate cytidylyltransferase family protein [Calditrichia bacterium]|nr:acylneuraminate cytidylyltransferase family protein [Calditrichota bacterium]HQU71857.1 acylneuraminate cytidylyltransferase family protein [Calditrichia bacterium]HQV30369.1 acylneuraminate cytidylyltransferase family protein [Calditrichia bacterium]
MIRNKSVLAVIPARGGSKGIPGKNIKPIAGKPLIAWSIEAARESRYIDRLILSSDDPEIVRVAKEWGCEVPFLRPEELARDDTPGFATVLHALQTLPENYDFLILLQPTSPLRSTANLDGFIEKLVGEDAPAMLSVSQVKKPPYWTFTMEPRKNLLRRFLAEGQIPSRRQDIPDLYEINGALYGGKTEWLLRQTSFLSEQTAGFIMDTENSVDIDGPLDFEICEFLLNKRQK